MNKIAMPKFIKPNAVFLKKEQKISNALVYDVNLSSDAFRLLTALNALPKTNWEINQEDVRQRLGWTESRMRDAIKSATGAGYLHVTQKRREKGRFDHNHFEFSLTIPLGEIAKNAPAPTFQPDDDLPHAVSPNAENRGLIYNRNCYIEIKQQHISSEETKEDVVVVSPEEERKRSLLRPYGLPSATLESLLRVPIEQTEQGILAYEQYKSKKPVTNPVGFLRQAILGSWAPNLDPIKENQSKQEKQRNLAKSNKLYASKMSCESLLPGYRISVSNDCVTLHYPNKNGSSSCTPIAYHDEIFLPYLDQYIKQYKQRN